MLTLYHSNRQEHLIATLAEITSRRRAHPLSPEIIISQSPGMARWIAIQLANELGVAAHYQFPLPATFFWKLFTQQFPELGETSGYEKPVLTWRIMKLLPRLISEPAFAPLARYLAEDGSDKRYHQLSRRIADVFDQYLIYRPEMVLEWEQNQLAEWQPMLWKAVVADNPEHPHRARLLNGFIRRCSEGGLDADRLPHRFSFFGIPTLPPAYLDLLQCLARHTEVNLFLLNPCQYYWGDIVDEKRIAHKRRKLILSNRGEEDYLETGNRLLASMGKQGQQFITALLDLQTDEQEGFVETEVGTMLELLQRDILELDETRVELDEPDTSISIHSCHSPMREVEVLHDQLLALFNENPELQPDDVIVMTPDVETYAPYIEAIFGSAGETQYIPWSISDRTPHGQHPVLRAFQSLLDVASGRFAVNEVLALLESEGILDRFDLAPDDLQRIRLWLKESGVRWGLDAGARQELAVESDSHTWAFGLRRLLLGYAMPGEVELYKGIAPYHDIEGQAALALGKLMRFVEQLEQLQRRLKGSYSAEEWSLLLNRALVNFFVDDDNTETALQWVRDALADLVKHQAAADYGKPIDFDVLRDVLNAALNSAQSDTQFLNGKLTFCTLLPMRSLPFKVIAMIGMNDGSFPRQAPPLGFDEIARHPRPGDRSRRDDERYLFLEALISARQTLYISYVGRDIRDNEPRNPSVLVAELLDYIEACYGPAMRKAIITEHPMQPFSARNYLNEGKLFSYAGDWLPALRQTQRAAEPAFIETPLSIIEPITQIELDQLLRFFDNPARAFMQNRLQLRFPTEEEALEDNEPFALDFLHQYGLKQEMIVQQLARRGHDYFELLRARGELPAPPFDQMSYEAMQTDIADLLQQLPEGVSLTPDKREIDLSINGVQLYGWVNDMHAGQLIRMRPAKLGATDRLHLWLQHLALCAQHPDTTASRHYAKDGVLTIQPLGNAMELLAGLIQLYIEGHNAPLHFYPKSSWAQIEKGRAEAEKRWQGNSFMGIPGDKDDPYIALALRGQDGLDQQFEALAESVFGPTTAVTEVEPYA